MVYIKQQEYFVVPKNRKQADGSWVKDEMIKEWQTWKDEHVLQPTLPYNYYTKHGSISCQNYLTMFVQGSNLDLAMSISVQNLSFLPV